MNKSNGARLPPLSQPQHEDARRKTADVFDLNGMAPLLEGTKFAEPDTPARHVEDFKSSRQILGQRDIDDKAIPEGVGAPDGKIQIGGSQLVCSSRLCALGWD